MPERLTKVSIVTPIFNEELCLDAYCEKIAATFFHLDDIVFEIIFVDDGSTDQSWHKIEKICAQSPRFKAIRLSRNFGSHVALSAGLKQATGDAVATLACDLQDPPEIILEFIKKWQQGAQIVWGKRGQRADAWWRRLTSHLFSSLLKKYAMPKHSKFCTGSFFLIDRIVVDCFNRFKEHNRITFALVAWTGFQQEVVVYDRSARFAGQSGWTFSKMLTSLCDAFVAFSNLPARLITMLGIAIWMGSITFTLYLLVNYFVSNVMPGWTGIMLVISFMFGLVFLVLGLTMEYLRRIHNEVINRPLYFISKKINAEEVYEFSRELVTD